MNDSSLQSWMPRVEKIAQEVALREGCWLYDIEFVGVGKGRTLRVFIDKDSGAGIEDCSNVSKGLNTILDAEDVIPGEAYLLEVSTPGLDRLLKKDWHFEKAVGKKIWVRTTEAFESFGITDTRWAKTKQIEQVLQKVVEGQLYFEMKDITIRIPLSAIEKAKVVFEMTKGQKNKKG